MIGIEAGDSTIWTVADEMLGGRVEVWTTDADPGRIVLELAERTPIERGGECLDAHLSPEAARRVGQALIAAADAATTRRQGAPQPTGETGA